MSDFDGGRAEHALDEFGRNVQTTLEDVSVLKGQVAALTAYIAHARLVVNDHDILAIKGAAQEATRYLPAPFGTTPAARHASEYVDHIHALAKKAGNEGAHG
jgi:hypothetical protein